MNELGKEIRNMIVNSANVALANKIIKLLSDSECTVKDATEILGYVSREIVASSKVQASEIRK